MLVSLALSGCADSRENTIAFSDSSPTAYKNAVERLLPAYKAENSMGTIFGDLESATAREVFDAQAIPLLESNGELYWYPQYLATPVIAVDREQTDAEIKSWSDLRDIAEDVSFVDAKPYSDPMLAAISYALEGDNYTLNEATSLLADIADEGRLFKNDASRPVLLLFDYQTAELLKQGRNLDIIIPSEGTLSFQRGLLSNEELRFAEDIGETLLSYGLRTLDGRADESLYPSPEAYKSAKPAGSFRHMLDVTMNGTKTLRREVFHTRLFTSADGVEHDMFALVFVTLTILWLGLAPRRIAQPNIRRVLFISGVLIIGWVMLRYFKYQQMISETVTRYCWYGYYLFQLALPLMMLALAWMLDNPNPLPRRAAITLCGIYLVLLVCVFTNDLHGQVFIIDLSDPNWSGNYSYGWLYYIVLAASILPIIASIAILVKKAWSSPKRGAIVFPLLFVVILTVYGLAYVAGVPIARDSDFTVTVAAFFLLYYEAAMLSGLVPINIKYRKLFSLSPLRMQIVDRRGAALLSSSSPYALESETWDKLKSAFGSPVFVGENDLFYADKLSIGAVVWREDVSELRAMHREIEENVRRLAASNALLSKELNVSRRAAAVREKAKLTQMLESEIKGKTDALSARIKALPEAGDRHRELGRIVLLMCCIKRRCSLFFREQEGNYVPADELAVFMNELSELAKHMGIHLTTANCVKGELAARQATLLYDFFYEVLDAAVAKGLTAVIERLEPCEGGAVIKLLLSSMDATGLLSAELQAEIARCKGTVTLKRLDDSVGIELRFTERRA